MSVPRPAMFVATVTEPFRPAWATIVRLALVLLGVQDHVLERHLAALELAGEGFSDWSPSLVVPTSTGWPRS